MRKSRHCGIHRTGVQEIKKREPHSRERTVAAVLTHDRLPYRDATAQLSLTHSKELRPTSALFLRRTAVYETSRSSAELRTPSFPAPGPGMVNSENASPGARALTHAHVAYLQAHHQTILCKPHRRQKHAILEAATPRRFTSSFRKLVLTRVKTSRRCAPMQQ